MDDLIVIGAISIAALYATAAFAVLAGVTLIREMVLAVAAGEPIRAAGVLAITFLFFAAYDGAGFWLRSTGRI